MANVTKESKYVKSLKFLPEESQTISERKERFERHASNQNDME